MGNISKDFLELPKEEKEKVVNELVPMVCSTYCCRDNCKGCFIQELTNEVFK